MLYKGNLRKNRKEKKNMRTKNKTLAIAGIEPPISRIFYIDRTQRPRQTRHRHSLKFKCRKSKYIVVTYINIKYCDGMVFIVFPAN